MKQLRKPPNQDKTVKFPIPTSIYVLTVGFVEVACSLSAFDAINRVESFLLEDPIKQQNKLHPAYIE